MNSTKCVSRDTDCYYGNGSCSDTMTLPIFDWPFYLESRTYTDISYMQFPSIHSNMSEPSWDICIHVAALATLIGGLKVGSCMRVTPLVLSALQRRPLLTFYSELAFRASVLIQSLHCCAFLLATDLFDSN